MKKKYRILVFFLVFAAVMLGVESAGEAIGWLSPRQSFSRNLLEAVITGLLTAIFFEIWVRRREKKSAKAN
jgi:hypothetical protein